MSNGLPTPPFTLGATYYRANNRNERVQVPCPACFGQKTVDLILGDGERVTVPCEACTAGYMGPRGVVDEWSSTPAVSRVVLASVRGYRDGEWTVEDTNGQQHSFQYLHATEAEALVAAEAQAEATREHNYGQRKHRRDAVNKAASSLAYHRRQIAECQKKIQWHASKIGGKA